MKNDESHAAATDIDGNAILPEGVPVVLPDLPPSLRVHTEQQFKALGDATRTLILQMVKYEPHTAKHLGERLHMPASTVGHHLQVLESAGLLQVCARRLVHGIVAKYYARTARLFVFDFPQEVGPATDRYLHFMTHARAELTDTITEHDESQTDLDQIVGPIGFPHMRLSPERAREYMRRLQDLIYEFATTTPDADGDVYGFNIAFFLAPSYLQNLAADSDTSIQSGTEQHQQQTGNGQPEKNSDEE